MDFALRQINPDRLAKMKAGYSARATRKSDHKQHCATV